MKEYESSYIIGVKGKLTFHKLSKAIGVPLTSPYSEISDEIIEFIQHNSKKITVNEWMEVTGTSDLKTPDYIKEITRRGMDLYFGTIDSNRNLRPGAMAFIAMGINYNQGNLIFKKESYA